MKQESKTKAILLIIIGILMSACTMADKAKVKTSSAFSYQYQSLKAQESWQEIIKLGLTEINSGKLTTEEISQIRLRLSSCHYYLGNYLETINQAKQASEALNSSINADSLARSYYLISAGYCALNRPEAEFWIDKAIAMTSDKSVTSFTKAKIYFNAGALAQDVKHNYRQASQYFTASLKLFEQNADDYNRTAIRNIRCQLELGNVNLAEQQIRDLAKNINKDTKTSVHLLQIQSKIAFQKERYVESYSYAKEALEIAKTKSMTMDVQRLEQLISEIKLKTLVPAGKRKNAW